MNKLTISEDYKLGQQIQYLITLIKEREVNIKENRNYLADSQIQQLIYYKMNGLSPQVNKSL